MKVLVPSDITLCKRSLPVTVASGNKIGVWHGFPLICIQTVKMASEIYKLRAIRDLTEHLIQRFPNTGLWLELEYSLPSFHQSAM